MDEEYKQWLDSLKVGDEVCVEGHYFSQKTYDITKIKTITPTKQIKTEMYPTDAFKKGKWWSHDRYARDYRKLIPVTQQVKNEIAYREALHYVANLNFNKLSPHQIISMYEIVKPKKEEQQ